MFFSFNNTFSQNTAAYNGATFFISNENSLNFINITENYFFNNSIELTTIQSLKGSTIFLINPANITIEKCIFLKNYGLSGACISYSETRENIIFYLIRNHFIENVAKYCGAGIYFNNKFNSSFLLLNSFVKNFAPCGSDYTSSPFRIKLIENKNSQKKQFQIKIIAGITVLNFNFIFLDYFGQQIKYFDSGFSEIVLRNYNTFSEEIDPGFKIIGKTINSIINGNNIFWLIKK